MSVDGTDFRIQEPSTFDRKWFSHKFRGPGLRYEIGLAIQSDNIVWTSGPYPAGKWSDMRIFREGLPKSLKDSLSDGERVEADKGYRGERDFVDLPDECLGGDLVQRRSKANVRSRHESMNRLLKRFKCLHDVFRHDLEKHHLVFRAVVYITQISLQNGTRLMSVEYKTLNMKVKVMWDDEGEKIIIGYENWKKHAILGFQRRLGISHRHDGYFT